MSARLCWWEMRRPTWPFPPSSPANGGRCGPAESSSCPTRRPRRGIGPWTHLPWRELRADPRRIFAETIAQLAGRRVYVSVDKDCLTAAAALTNWEEGRLDVEWLLAFLGTLRRECEIVGQDVTGEYSSGPIPDRWKAWCSDFDHPKDFSARGRPPEEIARVNGRTNQRIVEALTS